MKKYLFFILFLISSNNFIVSYPLSFGGGFFYQFTNYTDKTSSTKFAPNFTRSDHGINFNLFLMQIMLFLKCLIKRLLLLLIMEDISRLGFMEHIQ